MYLADTNVISETRRLHRANRGVREFFHRAEKDRHDVHLSAITIGELYRGVERLRRKGDVPQAAIIDLWLKGVLRKYRGKILPVSREIGELWGTIRAQHREPAFDKLIAATAISHGLTVLTRNVRDFESVGVEMLNPFD